MSSGHEGVRVLGISGSLRPGSYTTMAVRLALEGAAEAGARTQLVDLREYQLAFCDGGDGADFPPDVARLRAEVKAAAGIILGTPEYHGSFSGVLKNTLDLLSFEELEGKMIGLVGVSAGALGGFGAVEGLRAVGRALHAWVVPEVAVVAQDYESFTAEGRLKDAKLERRVKKVGYEVTRFASLHSSDHARQFLAAWETALTNPGAA